MKNILLIPLIVFSLLTITSNAQEKKLLRKAALATDKMKYDLALSYYDKVLAKEPDNYGANAGKGMVLSEFLYRYDQAIPYLANALKHSPTDTLMRINYSLGKSYMYTGNYKSAMYYYNKVYALGRAGNPDYDAYLQIRMENCKYAMNHAEVAPPSEQSIKNIGLPVNSKVAEYGVVAYGDDLLFSSERKDTKKEKRNGMNYRYFESMYKTTLVNGNYSEPVRFTMPDNKGNENYTKHNEAVISTSPDGKTLYIFRDGKIFESTVKDDETEVAKMNHKINIARYQNHAALSLDGNEIYFTSEGYKKDGGTDIYCSTKGSDGKWGDPVALDNTVNTYFNEDAPFMSSDGTLFFSSQGLPGYGGYDVFKTHKENGKWTPPENLGHPINSGGDDIYFTLGANSTEGYYSSARAGGQGDIDIYTVHYAPPAKPDSVRILPLTAKVVIDTIRQPEQIQLKKEIVKENNWSMTTVYFEFDKYNLDKIDLAILDKDIMELKNNPSYNFSIQGFADSRGTLDYNQNLSMERANFVKSYLIKNGISKSRISSTVAYGESRLVNNCADGVTCSYDEHQANRRVEFQLSVKLNTALGESKR